MVAHRERGHGGWIQKRLVGEMNVQAFLCIVGSLVQGGYAGLLVGGRRSEGRLVVELKLLHRSISEIEPA